MAGDTKQMKYIISAQDNASPAINKLSLSIDKLNKRLSSPAMGQFNKQLKKSGKDWRVFNNYSNTALTVMNRMAFGTAATGISIGIMFRRGIDGARKFDKSFRQVSTLINDFSSSQLKDLKEGLSDLSVAMGIGVVDATNAMYDAISAGIAPGGALDFLGVAMKAARAGATDTQTAVNGLTSIINAYKLEADDANEVSDVFFQTIKLGKTTFKELSANIGKAAADAKEAGVSYQEYMGIIASMTRINNNTSQSVTQFRRIILSLMKPMGGMIEIFEKLGVKGYQELIEKNGGLAKAMDVVRDTADDLGINFAKAMGRAVGFTGALQITGENAARTASFIHDNKNSAGEMAKAYKKTASGLDFDLSRMDKAFDKLTRTMGESFTPEIRLLTAAMIDLANETKEGGTVHSALNALKFIIMLPLIPIAEMAKGVVGVIADINNLISTMPEAVKFLGFLAGAVDDVNETLEDNIRLSKNRWSITFPGFPEKKTTKAKAKAKAPTPFTGPERINYEKNILANLARINAQHNRDLANATIKDKSALVKRLSEIDISENQRTIDIKKERELKLLNDQFNMANTIKAKMKDKNAKLTAEEATFAVANLEMLLMREDEKNMMLLEKAKSFEDQKAEYELTKRQELAARLLEIEKNSDRQKREILNAQLSVVGNLFGGMAAMAQSFGKEGNAIFKALAITETMITTIKAAMNAYNAALKIPVVGLGLAPIAAASAVAFGTAKVNQIRKMHTGGFVGGGLSSDEVPTVLQKGEFVIKKAVVQDMGRSRLEDINEGGAGGDTFVSTFFDVNSMEEFVKTRVAGQRMISNRVSFPL